MDCAHLLFGVNGRVLLLSDWRTWPPPHPSAEVTTHFLKAKGMIPPFENEADDLFLLKVDGLLRNDHILLVVKGAFTSSSKRNDIPPLQK